MPGVDGVGWVGEADGAVDHLGPRFVGVLEFGFAFDGRDMEHKLRGVAEGVGLADGDAVLGECSEDFAEDVVDVGGGEKVAGERGGEFGADALGFELLALFAGVERAKAAMVGMAKHAAAAAVGVREHAEMAIVSVGTLLHKNDLGLKSPHP